MTRDPAPLGRWNSAVLVAAILAAAPASAQEPGDTVPIYALDSLIVSVLRTPIVVGEAAYSVSVVGEEALRRGKTGAFLEEALGGVPGVQIQNRYNWSLGERIAIRGFGARAQFGVRGVRLVVDEIPATFADGQSSLDHLDVGALGRVEVLRGPASALYGNAAGGVIRFETRPPPPVTLRQEAQVVGGGDGLLRFQSITAGRAQGFGYHLSLESLDYDGYRTNPVGQDGAFGGATRRLVNGQVDFRAGDSRMRISLSALNKDADNPGSLPDSLVAAGSRQAWGFNVIQDAGEEVNQGRLGVTWEGPIAGTRGEVSGYGILRSLTNPIPPTIIELDRLATGLRGQIRDGLALGGVALEWTGGASLDFQRDDRLNFENDGGEVGPITLDQLERVRALAGYLQLHADLHPRLELQGGLRYDHFRFEAEDRFAPGTPEDASGSRAMDALSPSLGVEVDVVRPLGLFANVSTSIETPTTTELANRPDGARGFNPDLEAQRTLAVEAGVRGEVARRIRYEVTGYRAEVDDQLVPFEVPTQPGRTFFRNAGSSEHIGAEAFVRAVLPRGVTARASYTRTAAEFVDYTPEGADLGGMRIPGVAPNQLSARLRGERGPGWIEIAWEWVDEIPVNDTNTAHTEAYSLLDLRFGARDVQLGSFEASPFAGIRNLTDEFYTTAVTPNAFGGRYFEPGPGRTAYLGIRAAWIRP